MMKQKRIIREAFIRSLPILCSYICVGAAYGMVMAEAGYAWYDAIFVSDAVYTGAFQFVFVTLLSTGASMITIALTALFMNSRQCFYALTFLDDFKAMGKKKLYMIHTMTDETYAVNCALKLEEETAKSSRMAESEAASKSIAVQTKDRHQKMFWIAFFSKGYWLVGAAFGAVIGQLLPFDFTGVDFCMTALFVIIFIDQWESAKTHVPALAGLVVAVILLLVVGADYFLLPSLMVTSAFLMLWNARREGRSNDA